MLSDLSQTKWQGGDPTGDPTLDLSPILAIKKKTLQHYCLSSQEIFFLKVKDPSKSKLQEKLLISTA